MARDCTNSSTSNYLNLPVNALGSLINGASQVSVHAWGNFDTFNAGANDNRILSCFLSGNTGFLFGVDGSVTPKKARVAGRSVGTDAFQAVDGTSTINTGTWYPIGGVFDYPNDKIRVYVNGAQEANTTVTFGNTTYTNSSAATGDGVGVNAVPPAVTAGMTDGRLAECAVWNADITTAGFEMLADGYSALFVRPESLVFYITLLGNYSPEIDVINNKNVTINGTIAKAAHPRIIYPSAQQIRKLSTGAVAPAVIRNLLTLGAGL